MEKKDKKNHNKIIIAIIIIALIIDQITKIIAYKQGWNTQNESTDNNYYMIMTIIIVLLIARYIRTDNSFIKLNTKVILSFAISGAIGNLIDRIWNKSVITFIKLGNFLDLNLSYIYILIAWIGMAVILAINSMKIIKDRKNKKVIKDEYEKNKSK